MAEDISYKLTQFVAENLPTAVHMQIAVDVYDGRTLTLRAPLAPSVNDKGTAFGGSIYVVAVMSCWGMVYLRAIEQGIDPDIVVAKADIEYLRPVKGDIHAASSAAPEADWEAFFADFREYGKAKIALQSQVLFNGRTAVEFQGTYSLIGDKRQR